MELIGWKWIPRMQIGQGCTTHLRVGELPRGRLVVTVSRHLAAVIDGIIRDTHNPSRGGTRCVYGYFTKQDPRHPWPCPCRCHMPPARYPNLACPDCFNPLAR